MGVEVSGAVKMEDVPVEARSPRQRGIWVETTEQVVMDRKRGLVTVLTVKGKNRQEVDAEVKRMRNGLIVPVRNAGLKLHISLVRESDTLAKVYLQTEEIAPPPAQRRNGR